jgi:hypothetical protein
MQSVPRFLTGDLTTSPAAFTLFAIHGTDSLPEVNH